MADIDDVSELSEPLPPPRAFNEEDFDRNTKLTFGGKDMPTLPINGGGVIPIAKPPAGDAGTTTSGSQKSGGDPYSDITEYTNILHSQSASGGSATPTHKQTIEKGDIANVGGATSLPKKDFTMTLPTSRQIQSEKDYQEWAAWNASLADDDPNKA